MSFAMEMDQSEPISKSNQNQQYYNQQHQPNFQQGGGFQSYNPQQQQQQQQPGSSFQGYNPAFGHVAAQFMGGDANMGGAVAGMAAQFGQQHYDKAREEVSKYVDVQRIKYYFTVDTACVRKKLMLLLFPFLPSINWERASKEGKTRSPKEDPIAPDLYIPVMAFLTYVLTIGLALGTSGHFTPEQLGVMLSSQLAWTMFEVFVCYSGLWLMSVPSHPLLELLAFCSYKFVGMVLSLLTYIVTESGSLSTGVLLYNAIATGTVLVQTLRNNSGGDPSDRKKVLYFSLVLATFQLIMMVWNTSSIISKMSAIAKADDAVAPTTKK